MIFASLWFFHSGLVFTCSGIIPSVQVKIKTWSYKREGIWVCRKDQNRSIFFRLHFNCDACYPMKTKLSGSQPEAEEPTDHKTCLLATRWTTTPTIQCPQSTGNGAENCSLFIFFFCFFLVNSPQTSSKILRIPLYSRCPWFEQCLKKSDTTRTCQQGAHESCCHKYIQYKFHESYIHPH